MWWASCLRIFSDTKYGGPAALDFIQIFFLRLRAYQQSIFLTHQIQPELSLEKKEKTPMQPEAKYMKPNWLSSILYQPRFKRCHFHGLLYIYLVCYFLPYVDFFLSFPCFNDSSSSNFFIVLLFCICYVYVWSVWLGFVLGYYKLVHPK